MKGWRFNNGFAVLLVVGMFAFWALLPRTGLGEEQIGLIVGAGIVWIGQIVTYFYRKKPEEDSPADPLGRVPHG